MAKIDFLDMAKKAAKIADDKKAVKTIILDVRSLTAIANYFVITTAESAPQINAVCSEIEKTFKEEGITVVRREGVSSATWRVLDYGGLVVHVMAPQTRELYNLEKLWNDAKIVKTKIPVIKIKESEMVKKIEAKFNESVEDGKKAARALKKKVFKEKQAAQKAYSRKLNKTKKDAERKISRTLKEVEKKASSSTKEVKKGLKKVGAKVNRVKKTVKAVGKGIEAFGKTLVKKSPNKKKKKK